MSLLAAIGRWYLKHRIKRELKRRGVGRRERKTIMEAIQKLLTLDFTALKGWRTAIGVLTWLTDNLVDSTLCAAHPAACAVLKGVSGWFLAMGIRGK